MTREEIEKKAYEVYPEQKGYIPQDPYPPMEIDINAHKREGYIKGLTEQPDCPKIKGWVARDIQFNLRLYGNNRCLNGGMMLPEIVEELFPHTGVADTPIEVELIIKKV